MKIILQDKNQYTLRFDKGEDVIVGLKNFCVEKGVHAAGFSGIGACQDIILSFYNLPEKRYEDRESKENLEIVNFTGNVAKLNNEIMIHAHGSFANKNSQIAGGHVRKLVVSATCEVFLTVFDGVIERGYDEGTGLNLMK